MPAWALRPTAPDARARRILRMLNFAVSVLTIIEVLVALLLIGIILIQQSKAGGGLGAVGGGMTEMVLGASAGNVLTKITVILASIFLGLTLLLNIITGHRGPGKSVIEDLPPAALTEQATQPAAVPAAEAEAVSEPAAPTEPLPAPEPQAATGAAAPAPATE